MWDPWQQAEALRSIDRIGRHRWCFEENQLVGMARSGPEYGG